MLNLGSEQALQALHGRLRGSGGGVADGTAPGVAEEEAATEEEAGLGACTAISSSNDMNICRLTGATSARRMRRRGGMVRSNETTRKETRAVKLKMRQINEVGGSVACVQILNGAC